MYRLQVFAHKHRRIYQKYILSLLYIWKRCHQTQYKTHPNPKRIAKLVVKSSNIQYLWARPTCVQCIYIKAYTNNIYVHCKLLWCFKALQTNSKISPKNKNKICQQIGYYYYSLNFCAYIRCRRRCP